MSELIYELYADMPQDAPGNNQSTMQAFSKVSLPDRPLILDVGCGKGRHTLEIAKHINGKIIASDIHQPFLDILRQNAESMQLADRIECLQCDMGKLSFPGNYFDLIWSEGAIYNIGFKTGLKKFRNFLKQSAFMVITELLWMKSNPPEALTEFWQQEYPVMLTLNEAADIIQGSGFHLVDHFTLSESAWEENYYTPLEQRLAAFRVKYQGNSDADGLLSTIQQEINMYRQFGSYYSYEFLIMQKG